MVILDAATRKEVKRLPAVHGSGGIQMQPDGARAYVACGRDGYVAVIDLKTLEMVGKIPIAGPDGLGAVQTPQWRAYAVGSIGIHRPVPRAWPGS